jgi:hypothetical protein
MVSDENPTPLHAVPVPSYPLTLPYCLKTARLFFPQVLHYESMGLNSSIFHQREVVLQTK